ncbi:MAG: DUF4258 domain-containing protein [Betaproteobacteria bacterium]|nr:DUF4258 domain-containing protein [Betaproteobacteria bacterium]MSQ62807.1 DUF4258 domain-containing protein [Betaproteobacteria bacterium]
MCRVRFARQVIIADHARKRMSERGIDDAMLLVLVETGDLKRMEGEHLFIFKHFSVRHDNLVCAAAV